MLGRSSSTVMSSSLNLSCDLGFWARANRVQVKAVDEVSLPANIYRSVPTLRSEDVETHKCSDLSHDLIITHSLIRFEIGCHISSNYGLAMLIPYERDVLRMESKSFPISSAFSRPSEWAVWIACFFSLIRRYDISMTCVPEQVTYSTDLFSNCSRLQDPFCPSRRLRVSYILTDRQDYSQSTSEV
jgi:hypothetical protein